MKSVHQLYEDAVATKTINFLYLPSVAKKMSHQTAENLSYFVTQKGEKRIAVPNKDVADVVKQIIPHHDHKIVIAATIFHALDTILNKGFNTIVVWVEPSKLSYIQQKVEAYHTEKFLNISYKPLPNENAAASSVEDVPSVIKREDAKRLVKETKFQLGDFVSDGTYTGEVIYNGPNYVTVVSEGEELKWWEKDIVKTDGEAKRNQLYKESFIYKGYRTKNLNRAIAEQFKELAKDEHDQYAVMNAIRSIDAVLGLTEAELLENYGYAKMQFERAKRYSTKFGINISEHLKLIEAECLKVAIIEDYRFSTTDKMMIARLIADVSDVSANGIAPDSIIAQACRKLNQLRMTDTGWQIVGRMLKVAEKAGIKVNKELFSQPHLELMGLA